MASVPAYREAGGSRTGGKIVRARRAWSRKTPYERPGLSNLGPGGNPSWISRFIFSPTLTIASGAGKFLSSVFITESSSSSSDSDSEDDVEDDVHDDNRVFQGNGVKKSGTSEMVNSFRKDFPPEKKDSKHLIEQLLMQETFSRAERDKLFQIIESRVVECQSIEGEAAGRLTELSNKAVDSVCSTAILEAKTWLNEKRLGLGSSSTLELDHGPCTLNSTMLPLVNDEETGSLVDVAKSYMRERPIWASPSVNNFEFKSPSPSRLQLFKEETSFSVSGNPLSSSKIKRESPASGSWNIQEEIRRVRSKATEEMLRSRSSAKLDWSLFASDYKGNLSSARSDYPKIHSQEKMQHAVQSIDKSMNRFADISVTHNLSESKITQDVPENGACLLGSGSIFQQQDKDFETNPTNERKASNSSLDERGCSTVHEVAGLANGLPSLPSSTGELAVEENHVDKIVEESNSSGHDHEAKGLPVKERCELSEVSMEVPNTNDADATANKVPSDGNQVGKDVSEGNHNGSKEKNDAGYNVNTVEKPITESNVAAGKTSRMAYLRRGRRRN
ncbi:protein KAKU4-like isoform X2 [Cucurbita maxima]|uniref:Protein KAKU4-like isoform X2 n=1 Tax=Cucurbita maxima TaxID=3661 RepID=A0A6J1J3P7_CUCMA|nr:protein KAKU4-like isoform X2 [Cucurbita maxima]